MAGKSHYVSMEKYPFLLVQHLMRYVANQRRVTFFVLRVVCNIQLMTFKWYQDQHNHKKYKIMKIIRVTPQHKILFSFSEIYNLYNIS